MFKIKIYIQNFSIVLLIGNCFRNFSRMKPVDMELWLMVFKPFHSKAVVRRCSSKYVFLKVSQYSQENTCFRLRF